ncbi:MAG: hydrolase CocE/NonD family protein [Acidobacteria bacterium]|nr:hydrolase CocE/NonD family protein [Acidobacteriota bacterium]
MKRTLSFLTFCGLFALLIVQAGSPYWIARAGTGRPAQHTEVKLDPKLFDEFAGQYGFVDNPDSVLSFWHEGDRFYMQPTNQGKVEIFAEGPTKFFLKIADVQASFGRNSQGKVNALVLRQNGEERQAKRISDQPAVEVLVPFERREEMIAMRDGVRLHTLIFLPKNQTEALPILFNRTPYGVAQNTSDSVNRRYKELVSDGYIFVRQDIRGRYGSEGQFVMNRPLREKNDPKAIDESTDAYDTIEWLIKNIAKNNGRVGIFGVSYDGWLAAVATLDAHPALKASSPQAPMTDTWMGDDFFHNGAFREAYGYEYATSMETSKEDTDIAFDKDAYDWYLEPGRLAKITVSPQGQLPTWKAFVAHPNYDDYWKARAAERYLNQTQVATLVVGGWWDQEDFYGSLATYEALEKHDKNNHNFVVLGPWNHGGWNGFGRNLGAIDFGSATGLYFRRDVQAPWFAYYLKDKGKLNEAEAVTFQTGTNKWTTSDHWPPKESVERKIFLHANRKLSFEKPVGNKETGFESYVSDPTDPAPYRKRPIQATYGPGSLWGTWLVADQRFLKDRSDVLSWQSEVLESDLTVTGDIVAHLFASTTGSDSDWVVKLIDVYPDHYPDNKSMAGYQLMIAGEIFRGRFRQSFENPAAIPPEQVNEYTIDLYGNNHCFQKGHRVMVQIQSAWFPLYDRNPQKFVENIFQIQPSDYQKATQRVYESSRYPSHVVLPVMK